MSKPGMIVEEKVMILFKEIVKILLKVSGGFLKENTNCKELITNEQEKQ